MNISKYLADFTAWGSFCRQQPKVLLLPGALIVLFICYGFWWQELKTRQQGLEKNIQQKELRIKQLETYAAGIGDFAKYRKGRLEELQLLEKRLANSRTPVEQLRFLQSSARECVLTVTTLRQEQSVLDKAGNKNLEGFRVILAGDYYNLLRWLKLVEEKSEASFYQFKLEGNEKTGLINLESFIIF